VEGLKKAYTPIEGTEETTELAAETNLPKKEMRRR
jgi:hypothetical protein